MGEFGGIQAFQEEGFGPRVAGVAALNKAAAPCLKDLAFLFLLSFRFSGFTIPQKWLNYTQALTIVSTVKQQLKKKKSANSDVT